MVNRKLRLTGPDNTEFRRHHSCQYQRPHNTTNNAVINGERISGQLVIRAQNVTVKNSYISWDGGGTGGSGVIKIEAGFSATIDHVEINGLNHTHACIWHEGSSMTAKAINCYGINAVF